jgi:hypothetical protein
LETAVIPFEAAFGGVLLPGLLVAALAAGALTLALRRLLSRVGFYRLVWHPTLFTLALFVLILGGIVALTS